MHMLGGANWWLPKWLDRRLPRISIEPPECHEVHATIPVRRPATGDGLLDELVKADAEERKRDVHDFPG
jgi:RND superfamily putative drug exporter